MRRIALAVALLALFQAAPARAGFWESCSRILTKSWRVAFPLSKIMKVGGRAFHVYSSPVGEGGEGVVWRLYDDPARKLKVFTPSSDYAISEGRIDIARVGPLPQGYIRGWVAKVERLRSRGLPVPAIHEVGEGFVVMEYIDGVSYKQLWRKQLGYTAERVKEIRAQYWELVRRASSSGTLDGVDNYRNLLWDPAREQWFIIDP